MNCIARKGNLVTSVIVIDYKLISYSMSLYHPILFDSVIVKETAYILHKFTKTP